MRYCVYGIAIVLLTSVSCAKSNALAPSVSTPQSLIPTTGTLIANSSQPVTLVVQNAIASAAGTTYTFEVATDSAFVTKVQTKANVIEGTGGQTSVTLSPLPAGADYYWHAQAIVGGTTGLFSAAFKFTVGPAVSIGAPTLVAPANGAITSIQPTLTVNNATRTSSAGVIAYRFDISTNSGFANAISGSAPEGVTQTSFAPAVALTTNTTYFWRVTAIDQTNLVSSPASATGNFIAIASQAATLAGQLGVALWPGAVPPGTNGQAVLGDNANGTPNWGLETDYSPTSNVFFQTPSIEMVRIFDLLDRGYAPQDAINWMTANGYQTTAASYPNVAVIGFPFVYIAARHGAAGPGAIWDVVISHG